MGGGQGHMPWDMSLRDDPGGGKCACTYSAIVSGYWPWFGRSTNICSGADVSTLVQWQKSSQFMQSEHGYDAAAIHSAYRPGRLLCRHRTTGRPGAAR